MPIDRREKKGRNKSRARRRAQPLHHSIKDRLGYPENMSDREVLKDWKERLTRVCKPCWELKYCPYGPLINNGLFCRPRGPGPFNIMTTYENVSIRGS